MSVVVDAKKLIEVGVSYGAAINMDADIKAIESVRCVDDSHLMGAAKFQCHCMTQFLNLFSVKHLIIMCNLMHATLAHKTVQAGWCWLGE